MSNKITAKKSENRMAEIIFFILFSLVITVALLFKGLYFERELLPTLIGIFILFIAWGTYKSREKGFKLLSTPIDYLFLGVVLMYLLSITYGVNKREAVFEFSRYLAYFIIFLMTKSFSTNKKYEKYIINIVLFGGLLVSIIGIGSATGTWEYIGAVIGNRLSSTFQYPNTMGAYVGALYFIAMTALINEEKKPVKAIYGSIIGTFVFALILTLSRAMFLIFPLVLFIYFIIIPNRRKMEVVLYIISSVILSIPGAFLFNRALDKPTPKLWTIYLLMSLGTGIIVYLISLIENRLREMHVKKLIISLGILGLAIVMAGIYVVNATTTLTLENTTEENKTITIVRNTSATLPNSNYSLEIDYRGENDSESPYLGRVNVYNIDNKGKTELLISQNLVEVGENNINIGFTTLEDSTGIRMYFQNVYAKTKVEFLNANIIDGETSNIVKKIPLKYKYLNESFVNRLQSISSSDSSFTARMIFNKDGLKIIKEKPILGTGGGGWLSMYQKHQSYPYSTALAHNYLLQMWIEIGTLGFLIFLGLLILLVIYFFKTYKKSEDIDGKVLLLGLATTIMTMLLHAIVDFDMSLPAYAMVFWIVIGLMINRLDEIDLNKYKLTKRLNRVNTKVYLYGLILLAVMFIFNHSSIIYSERFKIEGAEAFEDQDLELTIENFEKVVKYDRYEGTYKMDLASLYIGKYRETQDLDYVRKAVDLVDKYIEIAPYDAFAYGNAAGFNFSIGEIDKGLEQLERSVQLQPMKTEVYIQKVNGYRSVIDFYLSQGDIEKVKEYLKNSLSMKEDIKRVNENAHKPMKANNELVKAIGQLQFLYENIERLDEFSNRGLHLDFAYYFDLDTNNDGNLDMLATSKPKGSLISHEAMTEGEGSFIRITNEGEVYGFKYVTPISLEPNATYVVELKARGTTNPETFNLYVWSNGGSEPNQGGLEGISLTNDWDTYSFEFTTDMDIEPGNQYIRIQHNGKEEGYIDVKDLVIFAK